MRRPTILVTRPDPDAEATAKALTKITGLTAVISPLIEVTTTGPLPDLTRIRQLIFTSRNAVRAYRDLNGPSLPAICVGEATAQDARAAGMDARSLGGDAEALIRALIREKPEGPLLHLRGETIRTDLTRPLGNAGIETRQTVIYRQTLKDLTDDARALLADRRPVIVPLYSPRTAARLAETTQPRAPLYIVAMSEAVARAAAPLTARDTIIAEAPDAPAMIRAVVASLRRVEGKD